MTSEVNEKGHFKLTKHCIIELARCGAIARSRCPFVRKSTSSDIASGLIKGMDSQPTGSFLEVYPTRTNGRYWPTPSVMLETECWEC
jgi:hypothetical protein